MAKLGLIFSPGGHLAELSTAEWLALLGMALGGRFELCRSGLSDVIGPFTILEVTSR